MKAKVVVITGESVAELFAKAGAEMDRIAAQEAGKS